MKFGGKASGVVLTGRVGIARSLAGLALLRLSVSKMNKLTLSDKNKGKK
jgi:hypothetical protein